MIRFGSIGVRIASVAGALRGLASVRERRVERRKGTGRAWGVEALEGRVVPATITVVNTNDSGVGSLRAAIEEANLDTAQDTIDFAPAVGGAITLLAALPDLSTDVIVSGPGASALAVARGAGAATPAFRIFAVRAGAEVTISGLTITGGRGVESGGGGGIFNAGTLTVNASSFIGNSAPVDGSGGPGNGGGIFNTGTLMVTASTLGGNSASGDGGGLWNNGTLTVTASTLGGNFAGSGGGIYNAGDLTVTASTLSSNSLAIGAGGGGAGLFNTMTGTGIVTDSTFGGNSAGGGGRAGGGFGGGIANMGELTITASTLGGNSAASGGGGIYNAGTCTVVTSTLSGNSASGGGGGILNFRTLRITASTLSGNSSTSGGEIIAGGGIIARDGTLTATSSLFANPGGNLVLVDSVQFVSGGYNLFSDAPGEALDPTDLINTDPLLGPLADNGGPTLTHALLPGSPAIDAGLAVAGVSADQRGVPRPRGAAPDIGAFESRGFALAVARGGDQRTPVGSPFPSPLVVRVSSPFGEPVAGGRVTFAAPPAGGSAALSAGLAPIDADGLAAVDAAAIGAGGTFAVTARATGANNVAFLLTNEEVPPPTVPPVVPPPTVLALRRFGHRSRRTILVLTFSEALDATRAQDLGNYELGVRGRPCRMIRFRAARYDASENSVTLEPARRLPLSRNLLLTVNGTPPDGLTNTSGVPLAGRGDGQAGSDFVARIDRAALEQPMSSSSGNRKRGGPQQVASVSSAGGRIVGSSRRPMNGRVE